MTRRTGPSIDVNLYTNNILLAPGGRTLYVDGGTGYGWEVVPVDITSGQVLPAIKVGLEPGPFAMTPNGKMLFVLDGGGETAGAQGGDITPINTTTDQAGPPILPDTAPTSMVLTPNGETLYVTDNSSVYPIDVSTEQVGPPISISGFPTGILATPNGKTIYVSATNGTVTPIDTSTNRAGRPIPVGGQSGLEPAMVITPNGRTIFALDSDSDPAYPQFGRVTPINTATNEPEPAVSVPSTASDLVVSPSGTTLYVTSAGDGQTSSAVTVISTRTNSVEKVLTLSVAPGPGAMVFAPDSRILYVANEVPGTVTPIDTATNRIGSGIPAGNDPVELAITMNGNTLYALDFYIGHT